MNLQLNLKKCAGEPKARLPKKAWFIRSLVSFFIGISLFLPQVTFAVSVDSLLQTVRQYGYDPLTQSFCVEQNGVPLVSYRSDIQMIPASVSKLYVTDWALSMRRPDFRYETKFYFSGSTLSIIGGRDPQLVENDIKRVFAGLTKTERSKIKKIVFDRNVIFNWQTIPNGIGTELAVVSKKYFGRTIQVRYSPLLIFQGKPRFTVASPTFDRILKEMNVYSNNSTADAIFRELGGSAEFKKYLLATYGTLAHDASFGTGSGTHDNMTTCRLTLAVLKHLNQKIIESGKEPADFLVIPGADKGSNQKRFIGIENEIA
jgi:D-alanyl-D-alanine carboxypeptidase